MVFREGCIEGSETTNFCTDEQKVHMRQIGEGKQSHLCKARSQQSLICRCIGDRMKECVFTWGDLGVVLGQ